MKKTIKTISFVLVLTLIMSITVFAEPGFAYNDEVLTEFLPRWSQIQADDTVISVTPGAAVGELRFAWLSSATDSNPAFKVSRNSDMSDAEEFEVVTADTVENLRSNKVTVTEEEKANLTKVGTAADALKETADSMLENGSKSVFALKVFNCVFRSTAVNAVNCDRRYFRYKRR